jgi:hypothetical protein
MKRNGVAFEYQYILLQLISSLVHSTRVNVLRDYHGPFQKSGNVSDGQLGMTLERMLLLVLVTAGISFYPDLLVSSPCWSPDYPAVRVFVKPFLQDGFS